MIGIPASVAKVYASLDSGAGNCLQLEDPAGLWIYLILDFDPGTGYAWNAFEGCCVAADNYYAVTPELKAADDYAMLLTLPGTQYWVRTNNKVPGAEGWVVLYAVAEEPKP
jgi:hypothetical protein